MSSALTPSEAAHRVLHPLAPSTTNHDAAPLNSFHASSLFTRKEWIIPPRPKPGRKPATDTPPTKRKAQNRAAQRAFRERRATKVGELEVELKQIEEDYEQKHELMKEQIAVLEQEARAYDRQIKNFWESIQDLEQELMRERKARILAETEVATLRGEVVPLTSRSVAAKDRKSDGNGMADEHEFEPSDELVLGCGNCTLQSRCACIEQALDLGTMDSQVMEPEVMEPSLKRPHSPSISAEQKRLRSDSDVKQDLDQNEVDFTTKRPPLLSNSSSISFTVQPSLPSSLDACGFCQDGSTCLCAELAADRGNLVYPMSSPLSDMAKLSRPMELSSSASKQTIATVGSGCQNSPGSCVQCQRSSQSTLFCKSLAATRNQPARMSTTSSSLLCNSKCNPSECCRTPQATTIIGPLDHVENKIRDAVAGPTLSCADAFTTLSRHPAFDKASNDLGTWLPKLSTIEVSSALKGRTAFEIEAASVMGVLRLFDRRFGSDVGKR